ncbi:hypothetical protein F2Q68_00027462 [Brassica cretica]|uniref:Uncharacterized protein n=1 Tax=Brassica cretica TaxID=69181 RepID=A0A8S9IAF4_BRACR|nr:hypothetical protein F2Q68_00027462 [Brassica cretica]
MDGCSKISDASLVSIAANCQILSDLDLSKCSVSDFGIQALASSEKLKLQILSMAGCAIVTDKSLPSISRGFTNVTSSPDPPIPRSTLSTYNEGVSLLIRGTLAYHETGMSCGCLRLYLPGITEILGLIISCLVCFVFFASLCLVHVWFSSKGSV